MELNGLAVKLQASVCIISFCRKQCVIFWKKSALFVSERECLCKCVFTIFLSPRCYKPYANYSCHGFQYAVLKKLKGSVRCSGFILLFHLLGGFGDTLIHLANIISCSKMPFFITLEDRCFFVGEGDLALRQKDYRTAAVS